MKAPLLIRRLKRLVKTGTLKSQGLVNYQTFLDSQEDSYDKPLLNLTIDFELAWSRARRKNSVISPEESIERGRKAKEAFPVILSLADQYNIPITFAVVGHLVLNECREHEKPPLFKPYWLKEDWFGSEFQHSLNQNLYFAGDMINKIIQSRARHEIASHGFTHVDLGDDAITDEVAKFEIDQSSRALKKFEPNLTTFIFPKNKPAFLNHLKSHGFKIYRSDKNTRIQKDNLELWQFPLGLWISPTSQSPKEIIFLLDSALKGKNLVNVWFHGYEFDSSRAAKLFLEPIFRAVNQRRQVGLEIKTMRDIIYHYA